VEPVSDRPDDEGSTDHDTAHDAGDETVETVPGDPTTGPRPKRNWGRVVLAVLAVLAVVLGAFRIVTLTSERDELQQDVERLEESLRIARGDAGAQIEELEGEVEQLDATVAALLADLETTTSELGASRDEVDDLTSRLDERRAERDALQEQIDELTEIVDLVGTEVTPMPDLLGVPIADVEELAEELAVELVVVESQPTNVIARPGDVIDQLPLLDTPLLPGSVVWVEVYTPVVPDE
jgi:outer membrane murein-binding lipoprotein Lpp